MNTWYKGGILFLGVFAAVCVNATPAYAARGHVRHEGALASSTPAVVVKPSARTTKRASSADILAALGKYSKHITITGVVCAVRKNSITVRASLDGGLSTSTLVIKTDTATVQKIAKDTTTPVVSLKSAKASAKKAVSRSTEGVVLGDSVTAEVLLNNDGTLTAQRVMAHTPSAQVRPRSKNPPTSTR